MSLVASGAGAVAAQAGAVASGAVALKLAAAVLVAVQAQVLLRRQRGQQGRAPQRAFAWACRMLALGLAADGVLASTAPGLPPSLGFVVGSSAASLLAFWAVLLWDRLGSGVPDYGDWSNALGMVTVLMGVGVLLVHGLDAPAAAWPAWQELVWLGQVATGCVLVWSVVSVGRLAGLGSDVRLWSVVVVYAADVVAQCLASTRGFEAVQAATTLGYVLVCVVAMVALDRELPARRDDAERPPVTTTHSLVVLGAASTLLLVTAFTGPAGESATTAATAVAGVGVVLGFTRMIGVVRELDQASRTQRLARTDDLTGVANRRGLEAALLDGSRSRPRRRPAALLFVDVRGFRDVNDRFGPEAADEVLRTLAARMNARLHGRQLLARLSGDQFAVLLPGTGADGALTAIDPLLTTFAEPVPVRGAAVRLTARVGVAVRGTSTRVSADELMRRAHVALYSAKRTDVDVATYDPAEDELARATARRVDELRRLLSPDPDERCGELVVHYQPQVEVATGRVVGAEALVRWLHPELGLLAPVAFIDLVERHGLMRALTRAVLEEAARESARWERAGHPLRVSVNLSSSLFADGDVVCLVDEALRESGASASLLVLEITETVLLQSAEAVPAVLDDLASRRLSLSVDDFGTGYSSLAYLADLPVDELKIDRSFVRRLVHERRTHAVVAGTIDLARRLDLRVVAEGVEDEATLTVLRDLGCDVSQGYLHARPLDAEALRTWYDERERVLD